MDFAVSGFDWDHGNRVKCQVHGVSIAEIEFLFRRPISLFPDRQHSRMEQRFKAIGANAAGRHIFVVFTLRRRGSETIVRPISARFMHRKEITHYEKQKAEAEKAAYSEER